MQPEGKPAKLLRLHRKDNVLIVVAPATPGDRDVVDGGEIVQAERWLGACHSHDAA